MNDVTTTIKGFRVEDVTFKNARRQCEIDKEIEHTDKEQEQVKAPISLTPEQVKEFYMLKITATMDSNEKKVYAQTIRWIDEMIETRKKLITLESKEVVDNDDGTADDIEE